MDRTRVLQEIRLMRFEEVYERFRGGRLSAAEAAEWLGVSERTFRRQRARFEEEGLDGLLDRRLGKPSPHRGPVDETERVLELYRTRYTGWPVKHFHDHLVERHGVQRSYGWTRSVLHAAGLVRPAPRPSQEAAAPAGTGNAAAPGGLAPPVDCGPGTARGSHRHLG